MDEPVSPFLPQRPRLTGLLARRVGWVLLVMTLVLGAALVATAWSSFVSVRSASGTLSNGQASNIIRVLGAELRNAPRPIPTPTIEALLAQEKESGLSYLALIDVETNEIQEAGTSLYNALGLWQKAEKPFQMYSFEERVVVIGRPPPQENPAPGKAKAEPRRWPAMVFEFIPSDAERLQADATRTLVIGAASTLVFLLTALAFARLLRYQAALERRQAQEQQLAALGAMSAVMAHEIRNPLTSLKGQAQLLLDSLPEGSTQHKKIERIVNDAVRLESLSTNLLDFVRSYEIKRQDVALAPLLESCVEAIDDKRVALFLEGAPERWSLDPERMQQTLLNLLHNALEASPNQGTVELRASQEKDDLIITVRDFGKGITPGQEEQIFTPFHTTRIRGTGLGLAVARRLVELHNGTITAQNHPEGGAVLRIVLPPQ